MPDGTVKLPGIGPVKKNTALAGGAVVAVVIAVAVYRSKKAAAATASDTSAASSTGVTPAAYSGAGDPYPPDGTTGNPSDPYSLDPASGMTYGDEAAGGSGYGGAYAGGYGYGSGGYSGGGGGGYPVTGSGGTGSVTPTFTDNASWAQYAESYLTGLGADPNTVGNALGKYITGQPVTEAQQSVIEQAIAFANQPPVSGSGGFPPSIRLASGGGGGGGGGGGHKKVAKHTVHANGHQDLQAIANNNGVTEAQVAKANPKLASKYEGTGHVLPKGTAVVIPEHTEKT